MKAICLILILAALTLGSHGSQPQPLARTEMSAMVVPLTVCAELPASAVNVSRSRTATHTECSAAQAKSAAILDARFRAKNALELKCRAQTSRAEAEAACAAHGLVLAMFQVTGGLGPETRATAGGLEIDATLSAGTNQNARLCVVLRDLEAEFTSIRQNDLICVFDNFKRTIFTAKARARCGVQCLLNP